MKLISFVLLTIASVFSLPDDDDKFYLTDKTSYKPGLSPVIHHHKIDEYESLRIPKLAPVDQVYLTPSEPKHYVWPKRPVIYKPEKVEYKSVKIADLSTVGKDYVSLNQPKHYVDLVKPIIKDPVYKHPLYEGIVYKKPVPKAPVVKYELPKAKVVTPEFHSVPALKTYSRPVVLKHPIYYKG